MDTVITREQADELLEQVVKSYPNLDPLEEGKSFSLLLQHFKQKDLADKIFKTRGYVGHRVRVHTSLIDELKQLVRDESLPYWEAYKLSGLSVEDQMTVFKETTIKLQEEKEEVLEDEES